MGYPASRGKKLTGTCVCVCTVKPPNNGHVGDECFVHCSEVVPSSEVEMYGQYIGRGEQLPIVGRLSTIFRVSISTVVLRGRVRSAVL